MRDINNLAKSLLQSEFETARMLYEQMRGQGYAPLKAAAMIYRHGYLDGKDSQKERVDTAYKKLYAKESAADTQPDNTSNEGSEDHVNND